MSKRSAEERIQHYNKKIEKLQLRNKRRRVIVYSSSSSDSEENLDNGAKNTEEHNDEVPPSTSPPHSDAAGPPPGSEGTSAPTTELDSELLEALGDASDDIPVYGTDIHEKLAQRWLPLIKNGIEKEAKDKLLKEYAIPGNCKLLKAPTLNAEISAAVSEIVRSRDKKLQSKQDQLGLGITAINRAISLLLTSDDKVQAVKILSDGCRILSDLHYVETQVRTKLITPGLDKSFVSIIQDQHRDETLFGSKLPDKIKASKAIEKRGLQIKKGPNSKPSTSSAAASSGRPRQQGNWTGPPRSSWSSRGGTQRRTGRRRRTRTAARRPRSRRPRERRRRGRRPNVPQLANNSGQHSDSRGSLPWVQLCSQDGICSKRDTESRTGLNDGITVQKYIATV